MFIIPTHVLGLIVRVHGNVGLATTDNNLDRSNLLLEKTSLNGGDGLLVRADAVVILLLTVEAVVVRALLSLETHVLLLVCVGETILEETVHKGLVTELGTVPEVGKVMRGVGHALGSSCDEDIGISGHDGLGTDDEGLDRRRAHLVDGSADDGLRETSTKGALAGGVLAKAMTFVRTMNNRRNMSRVPLLGRENVTHNDLLDILRLETSTLNSSCSQILAIVPTTETYVISNVHLMA